MSIRELEDTYELNVFINCPFDREYRLLFDALVFGIMDCGFRPVCARERMNSAQFRLDKIVELIRLSRYSVHDLSRTESGEFNLPRFNMPLELGVALGCLKYGTELDRDKSMLVLDRKQYRYHRFVSDISGQDIGTHDGNPSRLLNEIRTWLQAESKAEDIPGARYIFRRYRQFRRGMPAMARSLKRDLPKLTFIDYCRLVREWLELNAESASA